jgi:hypothetical protein
MSALADAEEAYRCTCIEAIKLHDTPHAYGARKAVDAAIRQVRPARREAGLGWSNTSLHAAYHHAAHRAPEAIG